MLSNVSSIASGRDQLRKTPWTLRKAKSLRIARHDAVMVQTMPSTDQIIPDPSHGRADKPRKYYENLLHRRCAVFERHYAADAQAMNHPTPILKGTSTAVKGIGHPVGQLETVYRRIDPPTEKTAVDVVIPKKKTITTGKENEASASNRRTLWNTTLGSTR
jgi:hypothetical protein